MAEPVVGSVGMGRADEARALHEAGHGLLDARYLAVTHVAGLGLTTAEGEEVTGAFEDEGIVASGRYI